MASIRGHSPVLAASSPLSASLKSSLPLPKALSQNRSFANLARLLGIASGAADQAHDEEDLGENEEIEEDPAEAVDEESLLWDAQTALIAHQPTIAIKYYTLAALPPHRSAPACLALGNLLARGSSLLSTDDKSARHASRGSRSSDRSDQTVTASNSGRSATTRLRELFISSPPSTPDTTSPLTENLPKPVSVGWGIPRVGNTATRDIEGMGLASAWLVLGLGWLVESERRQSMRRESANDYSDDDGALVIPHKSAPDACGSSSRGSRHSSNHGHTSSSELTHASSDQTDSTLLKTPYTEDGPNTSSASESKERSVYEQLKLMYDLLSPLVALYRHGQIQEHDPIYLPPIHYAQLPECLRPQGDLEKRRNAWQLGSVVSNALLGLPILHDGGLGKGKGKGKDKECKKVEKRRTGVAVMLNYLLGMTRSDPEMYFRQCVQLGQCGLAESDELVKQAAARLDIILRSPPPTASPISPTSEYPFPHISSLAPVAEPRHPPQRTGRTHNRISSIASTQSFMSTISARILPSMKSTASLASMTVDTDVQPTARVRPVLPPTSSNQSLAMDSLRRIRATSTAPAPVEVVSPTWWPMLTNWKLGASVAPTRTTNERNDETTPLIRPDTRSEPSGPAIKHNNSNSLSPSDSSSTPSRNACLRTIASTPNMPQPSASAHRTPRLGRRLPFEPSDTDSINTVIDPELAAAELRSALTKQVICGVCSAKGVNFPECRKCGLTFCSRMCRVDEKKAGDGKRHVCGAWESRKFLSVPIPGPRTRRRSVNRPSPLTVKA